MKLLYLLDIEKDLWCASLIYIFVLCIQKEMRLFLGSGYSTRSGLLEKKMFKNQIACFTIVMSCSLHKYHTFP